MIFIIIIIIRVFLPKFIFYIINGGRINPNYQKNVENINYLKYSHLNIYNKINQNSKKKKHYFYIGARAGHLGPWGGHI